MHLTSLILVGAVLACPLGMGLMICLMGKGVSRTRGNQPLNLERKEPS